MKVTKKDIIRRYRKQSAYLMLLPAMILIALFVFFPLINGVGISMTNWDGFSQQSSFIGFDNFKNILSDKNFVTAFVNTIVYGIVTAVIQNIMGLVFALLVDRQFRLRHAVKVVIYLPSILSGLVMGYMWYFMVQYDGGAVNDVLLLFGLNAVDWMSDAARAVGVIVTVTSIQFVGVSMMIYLSGLQLLPRASLEAAQLDGAGSWSIFFHIKLPLLIPSINTSFTLKLIGGFQIFDTIIALTGGGPGFSTHSLSTYINYQYFQNQNAGYAASIGILLFLFILIVSTVANGILTNREVEL